MLKDLAEEIKEKLRSVIAPKTDEPQDPEDGCALVGARLKPRRPLNSASIALPEP